MNPRVLKTSGFKHLDRVVELCAKEGIYTVLDMHTAPGGQNGDWHADAGTHIVGFFTPSLLVNGVTDASQPAKLLASP